MTTIAVESQWIDQLRSHASALGVPPDRVAYQPGTEPPMAALEWDADLAPVTVNAIGDRYRFFASGLPAAGYDAIRSQMQTLRALRQMGRNAFMALSQAERDRLIYDNLVAVTQIFIAMTRDS